MAILRKTIFALGVVLVSSVLWVGINLYLSYSSTELRGELLGSENVYQFLGRGMLDEIQITVRKDESLPVEDVTVDLLEPIDPYFSRIAFEKIKERIRMNLVVPPEEFHKLQNEAVMRQVEEN